MVKSRSYAEVDRYMTEYKMRTPFGTPTQMSRSVPDQHSARSTHKHTAHERSHARLNPNEAFYRTEGRIDKNSRNKKTYPEKNPVPTNRQGLSTTESKSSCCTIL